MSQTQYDEPEEEEQKGWPYQEVQDLDPEEREELLKQAGPVGEAVRMAWIAYQASQAAAGQGEPVTVPPSLMTAAQPHPEAEGGEPDPPEVVRAAPEAPIDQGVDTEEEDDETGTESDRQAAERKAAERGLEVRDFGTAGDWRVYDPNTGRQVAKSALDAPLP
jgi:hypothetical protein